MKKLFEKNERTFSIAAGFLLVAFFYRGGSLIPCVLVHNE